MAGYEIGGTRKKAAAPKKRGPAAREVVKSVRKAGGTTKEGLGVLREARKSGRAQPGTALQARANVYRAGRIVRRESGRAAAMKFNKAVARVEANQASHPVEAQARREMVAWQKQVGIKRGY